MKSPVTGKWVGWGLGDVDPKVAEIQSFLARKYKSYAGGLIATGTYDQATADVVAEAQRRLGLNPSGVFNYETQLKTGFIKVAPPKRVPFFTVEGHLSDMFRGPVADTATILENEGRVAHFPTGYDNGALPFNNASGENELAARIDQFAPLGTKLIIGGFSQGMIVVTDYLINHVAGTPREKDILGVLAYGNPSRSRGSVAPWSRGQAGLPDNAGMEPRYRLDLLGIEFPFKIQDVYRKGDIFSDNEQSRQGQIKSAVYEAVARSDFLGPTFSLAAQIADAFLVPVDFVIGVFQAIFSGIGFLANQQNNPHYSPFDISGGIDWARSLVA